MIFPMKRFTSISLILLAAFLLSACATGSSGASWAGLAADGNNAYLASGPFVYAVRLTDGAKVWQYPDKSGTEVFDSNPVLTSDGSLLVGSSGRDYGLISLDLTTGQPKWAAPYAASDHWVAPPLVQNNAIYAPNNNGTLYVVDPATGQLLWSLPLGNLLWGSPVTNGKLVFVTSLDHGLYAVDPASRSLAWKLDLGGSAPGAPALSSDGNTLYVGSFAKKVVAVDAASGAIHWAADLQDRVWGTPALDGDSLYVADMTGNVYSLGVPNGKNAWPGLAPDGAITANPLVLANGVLIATESGNVYAYDHTGVKLWEASIGGKIYTTPVASGSRILIAPMSTDFLLAAIQDGKLLWKFTGK